MALFRGKERETLPLLTRVSHVDADNLKEVAEFALLELPEDETVKRNASLPILSYFGRLQVVIDHTQRAMNAIERQETIDATTELFLKQGLLQFEPRQSRSFHQDTKTKRLIPHETTERTDALSVLMLQILNDLLDQQELLRRCLECGHVFQAQLRHPNQYRCSNRCTDRAAARRRRQKSRQDTASVQLVGMFSAC